jgi:hypothetical protein
LKNIEGSISMLIREADKFLCVLHVSAHNNIFFARGDAMSAEFLFIGCKNFHDDFIKKEFSSVKSITQILKIFADKEEQAFIKKSAQILIICVICVPKKVWRFVWEKSGKNKVCFTIVLAIFTDTLQKYKKYLVFFWFCFFVRLVVFCCRIVYCKF